LIDGTKHLIPDHFACELAVVAHSPNKENYKAFLRHPASYSQPLFMPPWSYEEILELGKVVFPEMSKDEVNTL
jgi:hypothetical protein